MIIKRAIFCILFFLFIFNGKAQEIIEHEKRIYVSPEGLLYIQKELPVYLRIGTSPDDDAKSYLLRSQETSSYSNPMYFDTEGYNTVRSPSAVDTVTKKLVYPLRDIIFEVYTDSRPPVTKANYGDQFTYRKDNKLYLKGNIGITLESKDQISGVNKIYYSLDGAPFQEYTEQLKLTNEKEYMLKFYAIDNVGNREELNIVNLVIDASKPVTEIKISGDQYEDVLSGRTQIALTANDENGINAIYYVLDNNQVKEYKNPVYTKYLSEGEHTLQFFSYDNVKNKEDTNTFAFFVDKTPPTIVEELVGNSIIANGKEFSSGRSKLKLTTFDNKAGVKEVYYSINDEDYHLYEKPFYLSVSGNLKISSYALDNVNNKSTEDQEASKSSLPYIDLSGPLLKHSFSGPVFTSRDSVFINQQTKIILKASDNESGIENIKYAVDNGDLKLYETPFSIKEEGVHKVDITAIDKVDNSNNNSFTVVVDNTGPEIYSRFSVPKTGTKMFEGKELNVYPGYVVLFLAATDMVAGFQKIFYRLNQLPEKPYEGYIDNFAKGKNVKVTIKAMDKLGNSTEEIVEFATNLD